MKRLDNEQGFALAVAIFALVVIGTLVAGSFFVGVQEQRVGRNTVGLQQAQSAAEEGAQLQVANWSTSSHNNLTVGGTAAFGGALANGPGWYRGTVTRLSQLNFLVASEGFSPDSTARQQVGLLLRLRPLELLVNAALKTRGQIKIGGSSQITGYDQLPGGWTCPPTNPALPGIRLTSTSDISTAGCSSLSCVNGEPKVLADPTISDSSLTHFGDATWADLVGMRTMTVGEGPYNGIGPRVSDGTCVTSNVLNWGDPLNPAGVCGGYFPIIYAPGDLKLTGGYGQGVLVVEGDLSVQGGFEFYGPVIVKGTLATQGTGGHFNGGVIAANVDLEQSTVLGDAIISYSSCAVIRALTASANAAVMQERSWINLY